MRKQFLHTMLLALLCVVGGVTSAWAYEIPTGNEVKSILIGSANGSGNVDALTFDNDGDAVPAFTNKSNFAITDELPTDVWNGLSLHMSGKALRLGSKTTHEIDFPSSVTSGKVVFATDFYVGTHQKQIKFIDANDNVVAYFAYSDKSSGNSRVYSQQYLFAGDNYAEGATFSATPALNDTYVGTRNREYQITEFVIDLDNKQITYTGSVMDRRSSTNKWCNDQATISFTNDITIKGVIIDASACGSSSYYAYFDNMMLFNVGPEAGAFNYTVNAVAGSTVLKELASGTCKGGMSYSVSGLPMVVESEGKFYVLDDQSVSNFSASYTMGETDETKTINYTLDEQIVYFAELETLSNHINPSEGNYSGGQASAIAGGKYASLGNLQAGEYSITGALVERADRGLYVRKLNSRDEQYLLVAISTASNGVMTGDFSLSEETSIYISGKTTDTNVNQGATLDYIIIRKTGDFDPGNVDPYAGEHYLYSEADGKFLSRGADWGTRAIADNYGVPANVIKSNDVYNIQFLDNLLYLGRTDSGDGYADIADNGAIAWTLEEVEGGFKLKHSTDNYAKIDNGIVMVNATADDATIWSFKTADEQKAIVAATQQANIVSVASAYGWSDITTVDAFTAKVESDLIVSDQTSLIKSASAGNVDDWVFTQTRGEGDWNGYNVGDYGAELFRRAGSISQTITVPEAGIYKLTLNALMRATDNGTCRNVGAKGYVLSNAYVSVNDTYFAQIPDWYSEADGTNPDNTGQAKTAFEAGKYAVTVWAYVPDSDEKTITITLHQPNWVIGGCWMLFNNFKLSYMAEPAGVAVESVTLDKTTATIALGDAALQLTATVKPDDADDKNIIWSSSDETVATVSETGVVTAINAGNVTITATSNADAEKKAECAITVTASAAPSFYSEIADGDFYIMNAATGKFLGGANSWGTQASLINHGIPFTAALSNGKYTLDSHTYNNNDKDHFFGGTYVDSGSTPLFITALGDGKYSISTADGSAFVTAKAGTTVIDNTAANANSTMAQWYFLSKADRDKMLAAASEQNPVDATYYIKEANISRNLRVSYGQSGWTGISYGEDKNQDNANYNAQAWHAKANVYQTIENLPNGTYKLRMQGFTSGTAYLYANDQEQPLLAQGDGVSSQKLAAASFTAGNYWNEVPFTVNNRTVTLGVKSDDTDKWLVYDNFELYMTSYTAVTAINAEISENEIETGQTATITATPNQGASFDKLTYTSSDETIATVDENGVVTGVAVGGATITITAEMENVTKTIDVTVKAPAVVPTDITLTVAGEQTEQLTMINIGSKSTIAATVNPDGANQTVTFASDNEQVVTVSSEGELTAMGYGTANITVTSVSKNDVQTVLPVTVTALLITEAQNLDFAEGPVIDNHITTYAKDMAGNNTTFSQMQPLTGWQIVENGDARATGVMEYGTSNGLGNTSVFAPAAGPDDNANTNVLGITAVWGSTVQYVQPVKMPAGKYTITLPIYRNGGTTQLDNNLIGVTVNGENHFATNKNYTANTWTTETITFTLDDEAYGNLSLGLKQGGKGDNAQRLWIDRIDVNVQTKQEFIDEMLAITAPEGKMSADVLAAFTAAHEAVEAATTSNTFVELEGMLSALNTAVDNCKASIANYEKLTAAINKIKAAIDAATTATVTEAEGYSDIFAAYNAGTIADADVMANVQAAYNAAIPVIKSQTAAEADFTLAIQNQSFEYGDMTGWTCTGSNDTGVRENSNGTYTTNGTDGWYLFNTWNGDANGYAITQTIDGLPNGQYTLTVSLASSQGTVYATANDENSKGAEVSDKTQFVEQTITFFVKEGTVTVGAKSTNWYKADNFRLVKNRDLTPEEEAVIPTSIQLSETVLKLLPYTEKTLVPTILPENAVATVSWTSDNETVATVDQNGHIKALTPGTATITVTSTIADVSATATVNVDLASPFTYASDPAEGDFYIRNVATGYFLGGGNDWGTRATVIKHAIPFGLTVNDGVYTLDSYTYNDKDNHFLGLNNDGNLFIDSSAKDITFEEDILSGEQETKVFKLMIDGQYAGVVPGTTIVDKVNDEDIEEYPELAMWQFISREDMLNNLKDNVTTDATFLLSEANISRNLRKSNGQTSWKGTFSYGGNDDNQCAENYKKSTDIYQDIAVPNGTYKVRVQGFYRNESGNTASFLYANDKEVALNQITQGGGQPNGMGTASTAFSNGEYWNELSDIEVTNNRLTIGIKSDVTTNWTIWDNFEVYMVPGTGQFVEEALVYDSEVLLTPVKQAGDKYLYDSPGTSEPAKAVLSADNQLFFMLHTDIAGLSTLTSSRDKTRLFWNEDKIYRDGTEHVKKATHHPYWVIEEYDGAENDQYGFEEGYQKYLLRNAETGLYLAIDNNGNITAMEQGVENASYAWYFDGEANTVTLGYMNDQLKEFEEYEFGFDVGEYTPYNNIPQAGALVSLREKANQLAAILEETDGQYSNLPIMKFQKYINQFEILEGFEWTVNGTEMNAVCWTTSYTEEDKDPDGYIHPLGWTNTGYNTRVMNSVSSTDAAIPTIGTAIMSKYNTTYGEVPGYTMPLKGQTMYFIKFRYCGWGNNPTTNVVISLNGEPVEVTPASFRPLTNDGNKNAEHWYEFNGYFTTAEAGNYVLALNKVESGQQQIAWTDMMIMRFNESNIVINENETFTPDLLRGNVTVKRTLVEGWNGLMLPFDMSVDELKENMPISEVKNFDGITFYDDTQLVTLNFADATEIKAGVPFLVKADQAGSEFDFGTMILNKHQVQPVTKTADNNSDIQYTMTSSYAASTDLTDVTFALINGNKFFYHMAESSSSKAKGMRAWFVNESTDPAGARLAFNLGDESTGISQVGVSATEGCQLYDLQGRAVNGNAVRKGLYIRGGKKQIVK